MRCRRVFNKNLGCLRIAEPVAGDKGILQVQADFVFIAQSGGDSALRPLRVGVGYFAFGQNNNPYLPMPDRMAARRPATPAPITRKSVSEGAIVTILNCKETRDENVITRAWRTTMRGECHKTHPRKDSKIRLTQAAFICNHWRLLIGVALA